MIPCVDCRLDVTAYQHGSEISYYSDGQVWKVRCPQCVARRNERATREIFVRSVLERFDQASPEDRVAAFDALAERFCEDCGCLQTPEKRRCLCWNDE